MIKKLILLAMLGGVCHAGDIATVDNPILVGTGPLDAAPHGRGNVYAPDVMLEGNLYRMWYGGQGRDGHDRILYAESSDGLAWTPKGVAVEDPAANHCNDPSVVKAGGGYFMFFTRAGAGVTDEIALATSVDGVQWALRGVMISRGSPASWDGLSVGRPSVMFEEGRFKLWYDGRKDLPLGAPDKVAPQSASSTRSVGYATSSDGLHWDKHAGNPVFSHDAGGVDVKHVGKTYIMTRESGAGTCAAISTDGIHWTDQGLLVAKSGQALDAFGHVTPCLFVPHSGCPQLYFGAARRASWDENAIAVRMLSPDEWARLDRPQK